ncbi:MAG: 4-hydroxy-tetrahydrodipicolinate reductase [Phycisphaera sp.]|nr:4-hydroxy-tetrahydrodipicolinate reductase [Phycisphaera sp.]
MAVRMVLVGARGRMGSRIDALSEGDRELVIVTRVSRANPLKSRLSHGACGVVVDFSSPEGCSEAIAIARETGAALLVGTTGLGDDRRAALQGLAKTNAVLLAPNTSLGVAVTRRLARIAAELLGPAGWRVDLVESHHDRKKDAPSGTAIALADEVRAGGISLENERIHAIRAGDTVGEHELRFAGPGERIQIVHEAQSRDLFALGALRAARWLDGRAPGWYTMDDVLAG